MATNWYIEATTFGNCNCDYNCPCQFELRPTHGGCRGFEVRRIKRGHFGTIQLDGLHYAVTYAWPGAIFEGNGSLQAIIDERADDQQRQALITVLHGGETEEATTHWWVFHAMSSTVHEPIFRRFEFTVDIGHRTAQVLIANVLKSTGRPIISPATGGEHRVRMDVPGRNRIRHCGDRQRFDESERSRSAGPRSHLRPVQHGPPLGDRVVRDRA